MVYLDGRMRSFDNRFGGRNLKIFEFMLSNPLVGFRKRNLLEKTDLASVSGQDCWKQRNSRPYRPIFFAHNNKHLVAHGCWTHPSLAIGHGIPKGKNGCCTWRFVVQEFDPLEVESQCTIL